MKRFSMGLIGLLIFILIGILSGSAWAEGNEDLIKNQLVEIQEEITSFQENENDKDFEFRRHLYRVTIDLMQSQLEEARKSGNAGRATALNDEIIALGQERDATWDNDLPLLEAERKRDQLFLEMKVNRVQEELLKVGQASPQKTKFFQNALAAFDKTKALLDQRYDLQKQLSMARRKEDFKTTADLYQKLKDLRKEQRDIESDFSLKTQQTLENKSDEGSSL